MGFIRTTLLSLLFTLSLEATEYSPWLTPLFEFYGRTSYLFEHVTEVKSDQKVVDFQSDNSTVQLALAFTPWPYWSVEGELYFTHTSKTSFSYEALYSTVRYAWLDDISGDCLALVTGATLSLPGSHFLQDPNFPYHGNVNVELHATIGKEFSYGLDWLFHLWALGGWGFANRGNPWLHGLAFLEFKPHSLLETGLFTEWLYGLGSKNLDFAAPFRGYGSINHQSIDIGAYLNTPLGYIGTLSLGGWYNLHAHNFIFHYWGLALSLAIPFSPTALL